jgi:putative transposase
MLSRGPATPDYTDAQIDDFLTTPNGHQIANMMRYTAVGDPAEVGAYLRDFAASTGADELIIAHASENVEARLRSVALTAEAMVAGPDLAEVGASVGVRAGVGVGL